MVSKCAQGWWTYVPRKIDEKWMEGAHGCTLTTVAGEDKVARETISKHEAYVVIGPRDSGHGTIPYVRNQQG